MSAPAVADATRRRVRARVTGTVQGVGFRPYLFRLSHELDLGGFVLNDARGVLCEVEGDPVAVEAFLARLPVDAPALARVEDVQTRELAARGEATFAIRPSPGDGEPRAPVAADTATCADCLAELSDPRDRRHRYPFINCTNCGPRFTIVRGVPYDRPLTTMAGFQMCALCQAEYEDSRDRRFHAQPNACPACGPSLALLDGGGRRLAERERALALAVEALRAGAIVAIKGVGGYHLACRADEEPAVARLRARKRREQQPFALMVAGLEQARGLVRLGEQEARLLCSPARPIVLAPRCPQAQVADAVAPGVADLGVMLAYSALHHLLLRDIDMPLVMTSGNASQEPVVFRDDDALARLAPIADLLLAHDRPIHTRTDDSVLRACAGTTPVMVRRSRGYAPEALELPLPADSDLLACGADLKSTFCLAKGRRAWISHHVGDLRNWETLSCFQEGISHFERLFGVAPRLVACDQHPDYLSSRYASERAEREEIELTTVQHHHAHLAACLGEHGRSTPVVGAIFDGSGLGSDGGIWGGELLVGDLCDFQRAGHLLEVALPGGDAAARAPWRMACAWLSAALDREQPPLPRTLAASVESEQWRLLSRLARSPISPITSSMGRLFDAIAALCGLCPYASYEGQAAALLESVCDGQGDAYDCPLLERDGALVLDPCPAVRDAFGDIQAGAETGAVASRFHHAISRATAQACIRIAAAHDLDAVVLSGGVFQSRLLLVETATHLQSSGLRVLIPRRLPPNDGAIAYGQAVVACAQAAVRRAGAAPPRGAGAAPGAGAALPGSCAR